MNQSAQTGQTHDGRSDPLTCWECKSLVQIGSPAEEHFCGQCGKVQPHSSELNYFAFLGLPETLVQDEQELEATFLRLSWKLHPDRFHSGDGRERDISQDLTSVLNDAYRTLRNPVSRIEYLLRLNGVRREGELKQQAPPELLEEIFELNEHLEEIRAAKKAGGDAEPLAALQRQLEQARKNFTEKLEAVRADLASESRRWDELAASGAAGEGERKEQLDRLNQILNRHQYIFNLVENVAEELEG